MTDDNARHDESDEHVPVEDLPDEWHDLADSVTNLAYADALRQCADQLKLSLRMGDDDE